MHSIEQLRGLLDYDPETGVFRWKDRGVVRGWKPSMVGQVAGKKSTNGHVRLELRYGEGRARSYGAHRVAWAFVTGAWPAKDIDHINGVPDDNRFVNLREATHAQNMCNSKKRAHNQWGVKGVEPYFRTGRWQARITVGGRRMNLGVFNTMEEAAAAYRSASPVYHGEFGRAE